MQGKEKGDSHFFWPPVLQQTHTGLDDDQMLKEGYSSEIKDFDESSEEEDDAETELPQVLLNSNPIHVIFKFCRIV